MRAFPKSCSFAFFFGLILVVCIFWATLLCPLALGQEATRNTVSVPQPLITQPVDESQLTTLTGNTYPLAKPHYDLGTAPASLPMERMLLVLKRSPEQEFALRKLLDDQQDKSSPNYHKWLTPEEVGQRFGPTDADMQTITTWLQSHGFQVGSTKGRTVLEFSGSASQVQEAFHTTIHKYLVNGEQHWANAKDPQIPTALTPAVAGIATLHNFLKKPDIRLSERPVAFKIARHGERPEVTLPAQNGQPAIHALGPQDYAVIYSIATLYNQSPPVTGSGSTIAVVARSNLFNNYGLGYSGEDVFSFQSIFNLPTNYPQVILNGPDPGDLGGGEEAEVTLDTTWSLAIAYNSTADVVVSASTNTTDGIDLSEVYIVENNLADVMTESFSSCELYATDAQLAFTYSVAEQAAAQGITYFVSTGDNGAEGCDDPSIAPATNPISVNLLASTPFNVAVGGTMFNENGQDSKYWGTEAPFSESAISYIPENVWNESSLTNGLWSGSGGASGGNIQGGQGGTTPGIPKPSWQSGVAGIPTDGVRDLPDVSLTAAGHDPYLLCLEASCYENSQGERYIYLVSGTSASTPSFASIMALVDQQMGGRQGQANYVLYPLAAAQQASGTQCNASSTSTVPNSACVFNDVTVGNNSVPGESGYPNGLYAAGTGYDQATGLGSANIANLINAWASVIFRPTTTTLKLNSATTPITVAHGTTVGVAISVAPNSGTGTPTGDASLIATAGGAAGGASGVEGFTLTNGSASSTTDQLPGGTTYQVQAHYAGDGTFAPSDSNSVTVTVTPEASTTTVSQFDQNGNVIPLGSTLPFGSGIFVRADVVGSSKQGTPTGMVTFTDSFGNLPGPIFNPVLNPVPLNSQGNTSIGAGVNNFDAGSHSISAAYGGDPSFSSSSSTAPVTFTIQPGFAGVSGPTNVTVTSPGLSGTSTVGIIASTGFTTAVGFTCSGLPAEATCGPASATGQGPNTVVNTNITVTTTAPHTTALQSNQRRYYFAAIFGGGLPLAGILLLAAPRRRRSTLLGLVVLALLVTLPACGGGGGGGGGGHQDPGTPTGTFKVTVTATAGSLIQQGSFTLTVQ